MSESVPERPTAARFPTTHWSRVAVADWPERIQRPAPLSRICCRDYWFPLYAFARRRGQSPHEAEDTRSGLSRRPSRTRRLASLDRSKGRFRSFLRAACDHYLANRATTIEPPNVAAASRSSRSTGSTPRARYDREPAHELTAERLFEQQWALTLLERVLDRLEAESTQAGKAALFARLRPVLQGSSQARAVFGDWRRNWE